MHALRRATAADLPLLRAALYEAACWRPAQPRPPLQEVLGDPKVARYLEGWLRPGDGGVVAELGGVGIGAIWWRRMTTERPGYGFVDEHTPELSLAVLPGRRRQGAGTQLIGAALEAARAAGVARLSLSVEPENPALELYRRAGFEVLEAVDGALTLVRETGAGISSPPC